MRLSVRQLECLVAVADALHFGRAARRLALTQPALSAQVRQAEELLGVRVFERGHRRVLVTQAGRALVERARAALREIDAVSETARAAQRPLVGPLHLGVIPTVAPYWLPRGLARVRRAHPELRLVLREEKTDELLRRLEQGDLELLLLALPVEGASLETRALHEEAFAFVAPPSHPLAAGRRPLSEAELAGAGALLLLEDGHCLRDQALSVCERSGAREDPELRATSLGTLLHMVAGGLGATLLPESALEAELRAHPELVVRRFRAPAPGRTLGLAWRRGSARAGEFVQLGELLAPPSPKRRAR